MNTMEASINECMDTPLTRKQTTAVEYDITAKSLDELNSIEKK